MDFWISFANFFASAIRLTAPIALGTLACTISERAGVINIGIEGSMIFSGFLAAVGSYYTGSPWVGLLCGCAGGAFLALILGVLAIYCNGQQIVIGIGLNLFVPGFAYMLMRALWDTTGISPWVEGFHTVNIPVLSNIPVLGTMLSGYPSCVYLGLLAVAVMQYLLRRTAWGLRIRAVGENPAAVATLGINVYRLRLRAVLLGGVFAGMAGAVMCLSSANVFVNDMSAGTGFMAFAANQVVASGGGIVVADGGRITGQVVLEIAGLMSEGSLPQVNARLEQAKAAAFRQGVNTGIDPFMTLSFMSLPVIPQLRLTTRGVIDVATQQYL